VRRTFATTLAELAEGDPRIVLLTGDLGFMALEPFSDRVPDRFFNVGVAEQNLTAVATGLAEAGFLPFTYSIATFATMRAFEFIRNGPVLHRLPVRIVGVGGGFEYGSAGYTHHALEDLALARSLRGLRVIAPADFQQARSALLATWDAPEPIYFRLGKDDATTVPDLDGRFDPAGVEVLGTGEDVLLVTTGAITVEVTAAAQLLARNGIDAAVAVVANLNPAPVEALKDVLGRYRLAIAVEAHAVSGGLGSLVAEVIAETGVDCRLERRGVSAGPDGISGSQSWLQRKHGLDRQSIADAVTRALAAAR